MERPKAFLFKLLAAAVLIVFFQNCSSLKWPEYLVNNQSNPESTGQVIAPVEPSSAIFSPELSVVDITTNTEILTTPANNSISLVLSSDSHFALKIRLEERIHIDEFSCKWTFAGEAGEIQSGDCKEYVDHPLVLQNPILPGTFRLELGLNGSTSVRSLTLRQSGGTLAPPPPSPPAANSANSFSTVNDSTYSSNFQIVPGDLQWTSQAGEKTGYLGLQGHVYTGYIGGPGWIPEGWVTLDPGESVRFKVLLPPGLSIGMIGGEMPTVIGTLCAVYDQDLPLNQIDQSKLVLRNHRVSIELKAANSGILQQPKAIYVVCYQRPSDMVYPHQWGNFTLQYLIKDTALFDSWFSKNK